MLLISPLIDAYFSFRLKDILYRNQCYQKVLNKELRLSKLGTILLRNLNEAMSLNREYHDEFAKLLNDKDYQQAFWESDLGFLWYQGNLQQQNKYFELALCEIKEKKYKSHLDVGCGWGELSNKAAEFAFVEVALGIDVSEDIIDKAKEINKNSKAIYQCKDVLDIEDKFDLITLFGSTDYILPTIFNKALDKIIISANREIIIVNSLRKVKFEESLSFTDAKEITRYDIGYVQPINYLLKKLSGKHKFTYDIKKFGLDSSLTTIKIIR
jgi:SAM-dependent methyltransferase